ncbi:coiled-coil domain-containing protein 63 isoform X2 [Cimex lectularius]|nr:coiled-coil domain-containing protein 63 isoform X2 [Cimex lectularius]
MTKNGRLREEIEHLLKERCRFKKLLDDQLKLLKAGKKSMLDMIEQSSIAFEHREESQAKLDALNEKSISLKETHTQQMRDLDRLLYTDTERVQFLTIKGQYRMSTDQNSKKEAGGLIRKQDIENLRSIYNTVLLGISPYTEGEEKIDSICEAFKTNEDENFAIFNYVNEVNCEAESLHDAAKVVKKKIEKERALKVERVAQQSEDVRTLGMELAKVQEEIDELEVRKNRVANHLSIVTSQLNGIVSKVQCHSSPFYNLLGDNTCVNLNNVHLFLLVLEKQIMRIMKRIMDREKCLTLEEQLASKDSISKASLRKHKLRLSRKKLITSPIPE